MALKRLLSVFILSLLFVVQFTDSPYSSEAGAGGEAPAAATPAALWVPSFNFMLDGRVAIDDRSASGGEAASGAAEGGAAAGAEGEGGGEEDPPSGSYNSDELSRWHQEKVRELEVAHSATKTRFARNVAVVMLSLFYTREDQLLVRHVEIPHLFLSGFSVEDAPVDQDKFSRSPICIQALYAESSAYQSYRTDLVQIFRGTESAAIYDSDRYKNNKDGTVRVSPSKRFRAEECHSERGIAIYLRNQLVLDDASGLSRRLLIGIEPGRDRILALIINVASYRDMCGSCQNTFLQELTYGHLFLNQWRNRLKESGIADEVPVVVAQSGVKEYTGDTVNTRRAESGFVVSDMRLNQELRLIRTPLIYMDNGQKRPIMKTRGSKRSKRR